MTDEATKILSPSELPPAMATAFKQIYRLKREIKALKAEHIDPLAQDVTALWRDLKAGSDITRKDLELAYQIVARMWDAEAMEDRAEGERIQENIRRAFAAARKGEMINFLDVISDGAAGAESDAEDSFEDDVLQAESGFSAGHGDEETSSAGPAPLDFADDDPRAENDEPVAAPDAEWGDDVSKAPAEQDNGDTAGFAYQEGERAGLAGNTDIKALITAAGYHHASALAKSFKAGHSAGLKKFTQRAQLDHVEPMTLATPAITIFDQVDDSDTVVPFSRTQVGEKTHADAVA